MIGAYFAEAQGTAHQNGHVQGRRFQPYRQLLNFALRHRLTTIAIALAFFISLMLVPHSQGFITATRNLNGFN